MEKVFLNQATQVFPSVSSVLAVFRIRIHVSESFKVSVSDSMTLGTQCEFVTAQEEYLHGRSKLLPENLARQ
jgi:hypothetical protein